MSKSYELVLLIPPKIHGITQSVIKLEITNKCEIDTEIHTKYLTNHLEYQDSVHQYSTVYDYKNVKKNRIPTTIIL